jgi:hypothetical protein
MNNNGCIVEFTLVPAAISQDFKTEGEGKDNENSLILHLIYTLEKWLNNQQKGGVKAKIMKRDQVNSSKNEGDISNSSQNKRIWLNQAISPLLPDRIPQK